jgi:hypothetical protein
MPRKPKDPTQRHRHQKESSVPKKRTAKDDRTPNQLAFNRAVAKVRKAEGQERVERFLNLCRGQGVPEPEHEVAFHPDRKWRFDMAWPEHRVALEVEGGAFVKGGGRHNRGAGFIRDIAKYNAAALLGWVVLRTIPSKLAKPATVRMVRDMLAQRELEQRRAA